jgi:hypothetical protein
MLAINRVYNMTLLVTYVFTLHFKTHLSIKTKTNLNMQIELYTIFPILSLNFI